MFSRGVAAFLGGFTLLNLIGASIVPGFDANDWWIDPRPVPPAGADNISDGSRGRLAHIRTASEAESDDPNCQHRDADDRGILRRGEYRGLLPPAAARPNPLRLPNSSVPSNPAVARVDSPRNRPSRSCKRDEASHDRWVSRGR